MTRPIPPGELGAVLRELAGYLELEGEPHRARAYHKAADTLDAVHDLEARVREGRLTDLPNVGASIARTIGELSAGRVPETLARLRAAWPAVVVELAGIPGVGSKRARAIVERFQPPSIEAVAELAAAGRLRELPGLGAKTEAKLAAAIRAHAGSAGPEVLLAEARALGAALLAYLRGSPAVRGCVEGGPARRALESADHLAVAVATDDPDAVVRHLAAHPSATAVTGAPPTIEVRFARGPRAIVHLAGEDRLGLATVIATGDDAHVAALVERAAARGIALAERAGDDEAGLYRALGLPPIPPELRDGTDELALAEAGGLDRLVRREDIRGFVHCHTVYSDGKHTIEEMARAADAAGMAYLTITDHSRAAGYAGGLDVDRLRAQWDEIAEVQDKVAVRLLRGSEVDILEDGALDFPDDVLDRLDVVIASIHQRHKLDEAAMTARVVRAMRHPRFKIWGHPFGRLVLSRPPIPCRFDEVLDAIVESRAAIEINGDPHRLDLEPEKIRRARARGIRFVLSTDAHSTGNLAYLDNAVELARRARVTAAEVLNALPADDFVRAVGAG